MNSLSCNVELLIKDSNGVTVGNEDGNSGSREIEARANAIIQGLERKAYKLEVRVDHSCREVTTGQRRFDVAEAANATVTGYVIRADGDRGVELVQLHKPGEPKKAKGGNNRVK